MTNFEKWWITAHQTIGKVAAKLAWDYQQETIDHLLKQIEQRNVLEEYQKRLNAQVLMNAVESGNRNYLAEIEYLRTRIIELEIRIKELEEYKQKCSGIKPKYLLGHYVDIKNGY